MIDIIKDLGWHRTCNGVWSRLIRISITRKKVVLARQAKSEAEVQAAFNTVFRGDSRVELHNGPKGSYYIVDSRDGKDIRPMSGGTLCVMAEGVREFLNSESEESEEESLLSAVG